MSGFKGSYLRILTPRTSDGMTLEYEADGSIAYRESHAANTRVAKEVFEKHNARRPKHLQHIIEVVGEDIYVPGPKPNPQATVIQEPPKVIRHKPGPKPKSQQTAIAE